MPNVETPVIQEPVRVDPIDDDIVLDAQLGDEMAGKRVLLAYLPIIRKLVKKYSMGMRSGNTDDLKSEGYLALYRAIRSWDPDQHGKFVGYAYNYLRQEIKRAASLMQGRGRGGKQKRVPMTYLDKPLGEGEDARFLDLPSTAPSPEEEVLREDEARKQQNWKTLLMQYVENMPGRQGKILRSRFVHGMELDAIAKQEGIARSTVQTLVADALEKVLQDIGSSLDDARRELGGPAPGSTGHKPHAD